MTISNAIKFIPLLILSLYRKWNKTTQNDLNRIK